MRAIERAIAIAIVGMLLVNFGTLIGLTNEERASAATSSAGHPTAQKFVEIDQPYDYRGERYALEALRLTVIHERNLARLRERRQRQERERQDRGDDEGGNGEQAAAGHDPGLRRVAAVVAACESGQRRSNGTAIVGTHNWRARNPTSSAAGAWQFLTGTWRRAAQHVGAGQYPTAAQAPPHLQAAAFEWLYARQGLRPWQASASCWSRMLR